LRQFYTLVSNKLATKFFEGNPKNLLSKVDANTCLSEILIVIGKIISHRCNGFPFLSESAFYYICHGSIKDATHYVTLDQVANNAYMHYINQVFIIKFVFLFFYLYFTLFAL